MTSTESGNSTMPVTMEVRFQDSKKKNIAAETGMISVYRHISRWKDMMHRSMPMYSIRGKAMKNIHPGEIPEHFNPVASYVKYFEVPEEMQGKRLFISFQGAESGIASMAQRTVCGIQ